MSSTTYNYIAVTALALAVLLVILYIILAIKAYTASSKECTLDCGTTRVGDVKASIIEVGGDADPFINLRGQVMATSLSISSAYSLPTTSPKKGELLGSLSDGTLKWVQQVDPPVAKRTMLIVFGGMFDGSDVDKEQWLSLSGTMATPTVPNPYATTLTAESYDSLFYCPFAAKITHLVSYGVSSVVDLYPKTVLIISVSGKRNEYSFGQSPSLVKYLDLVVNTADLITISVKFGSAVQGFRVKTQLLFEEYL